jgi:hypothetical protein
MTERRVFLILAVILIACGYAALRLEGYYEAQRWQFDVSVRAPAYENSSYPYGSQSPPNAIVGYIEVGTQPDARSMDYGKDYPYWEVRLASGQRGYLFGPDVRVRPK